MPPEIRPFNPPVIPPDRTPARPASSALAAQRAFFQQAVVAEVTPVAPSAPRTAQACAAEPTVTHLKTTPIPDEKPTRYMRPGSFVDIKV